MNLFFLSGLPRSGSTVLSAILNQNPKLKVSTTSGLVVLLQDIVKSWGVNLMISQKDTERTLLCKVFQAVIKTIYPELVNSDKYIIDKSRSWVLPEIIQSMNLVLERPVKIIVTVRSVPECAASFVRVAKPDNLVEFINGKDLIEHLKASYVILNLGYTHYPDTIHFVEYHNLIKNPKEELDKIMNFLELPSFEYNFTSIDTASVEEDDEVLHNYKNLHTIGNKLEYQNNQSAREVLGEHYNSFCQDEFWNPNYVAPSKEDLDLALEYSLKGDIETGEKYVDKQLSKTPQNVRALFNKGWYLLSKGNFLMGMRLISVGRNENLFGNPAPSMMPLWTNECLKGKTLLFNLEGGLGDQICNIRFAKYFHQKGAKVIVAGNHSLANIFLKLPYVHAFMDGSVAGGIYHDFWVPSMSAPLLLGFEYKDLDGKAYLPCNKKEFTDVPLRVGIRWSGNPQFEHEQHRCFDPTPLFNLKNVQLVNLQKDGDIAIPDHLEQNKLDTWEDTVKVIESCDLIISSCTSVAHMSAAMGKPTWVIVPITPYYLWALPGETSPWYNSVKLIRQDKYKDWSNCFEKINNLLSEMV